MWSHWAAEVAKRAYVEDAAKRFEASRPGVKIKITWYEKSALYAALKTALRAGQAPDVFYAEPDQTEYIDNQLLADLSTGINWANVEPWAKTVWTFGKGVYGFPLEASTVEVYYNTKLMADLGVTVPANGQFDQASVPRSRQEGQSQRHHADVAGRRRPPVPRQLHHARGAAQETRDPRTTTPC